MSNTLNPNQIIEFELISYFWKLKHMNNFIVCYKAQLQCDT